MSEEKKKRGVFQIIFRISLILYFFGIVIWNTMFTGVSMPDFINRKVYVEKIDSGEFTTGPFDYFSPYDRRITVADDDLKYLFVSSDLEGFDEIKENDSLWVELVCLEASTWGDFFFFGSNFNYELYSIPNQDDSSLEQDSLYTSDFWIALIVIGFILGSILVLWILTLFGVDISKEKAKKILKKK